MKKKIFLFATILVGILCVSCTKQLYTYQDYDEAAYSYSTLSSKKDIKKISKSYEKIVTPKGNKSKKKFKETRIPPGACMDYAYLMLQQKDTNACYSWLEKELALYPESVKIVDNFKKMNGI